MDKVRHVKVGELEIPADYFSMDEEYKKELCLILVDAIITAIDKHVNPKLDRVEILDKMLDSSIQTNEQDENYEVCQFLNDIKQIINE
jgi:hypothetical protein